MKNKKLIALLLALVLVLVACGGGSDKDSETVEEPNESTEIIDEQNEEPESEAEDNNEPEEVEDEPEEDNESEEADEPSDDTSIVLGEPIEFEDFIITIKEFSVADDYEGIPALVIAYDWENIGEESEMPFLTFSVKGFQDGVETNDDAFMVDGVDLGIGQKEVKSGGKLTDAQTVVGIDDMEKPLELELSEAFSFDKTVYTYTIDDLNNL